MTDSPKLIEVPADKVEGLHAVANKVLTEAMAMRDVFVDTGMSEALVENLLGSVYLKVGVLLTMRSVKGKMDHERVKAGVNAMTDAYVDFEPEIEVVRGSAH